MDESIVFMMLPTNERYKYWGNVLKTSKETNIVTTNTILQNEKKMSILIPNDEKHNVVDYNSQYNRHISTRK